MTAAHGDLKYRIDVFNIQWSRPAKPALIRQSELELKIVTETRHIREHAAADDADGLRTDEQITDVATVVDLDDLFGLVARNVAELPFFGTPPTPQSPAVGHRARVRVADVGLDDGGVDAGLHGPSLAISHAVAELKLTASAPTHDGATRGHRAAVLASGFDDRRGWNRHSSRPHFQVGDRRRRLTEPVGAPAPNVSVGEARARVTRRFFLRTAGRDPSGEVRQRDRRRDGRSRRTSDLTFLAATPAPDFADIGPGARVTPTRARLNDGPGTGARRSARQIGFSDALAVGALDGRAYRVRRRASKAEGHRFGVRRPLDLLTRLGDTPARQVDRIRAKPVATRGERPRLRRFPAAAEAGLVHPKSVAAVGRNVGFDACGIDGQGRIIELDTPADVLRSGVAGEDQQQGTAPGVTKHNGEHSRPRRRSPMTRARPCPDLPKWAPFAGKKLPTPLATCCACLRGAARYPDRVALSIVLSLWLVGAPAVDDNRARTAPSAASVRARIDQADFEGAKRALVAAESRPDLRRAEFIELLELRALIHLAFGEKPQLRRALRRLAALDYNRRFSPQTNPDLVAEYLRQRARLAGPLAIRVRSQATPTGFRLNLDIEHPIDVVSHASLEILEPEGWRRRSNLPTEVILEPGEAFDYRARVLMGRTVLAEETGRLVRPEDDGLSPWIWAGAAAVVVAAVVTTVVVVAQPSDGDPTASAPEVIWP